MIAANAQSKGLLNSSWRPVAVAATVLLPVLLVPTPFKFYRTDPLQAVAIGGARDAVPSEPVRREDFAKALSPTVASEGSSSLPSAATPFPTDSSVTAYATVGSTPDVAAAVDPAAALGIDLVQFRAGVDAYRRGDVAAGDAIASRSTDEFFATALAWVWLRTHPAEAGLGRITKFIADHPDWPANDWLRKRADDLFYAGKPAPAKVRSWFAARAPQTPLGRIALARALSESGDKAGAATLIRTVWAKDDLPVSVETAVRKQFGEVLGPADYKARADRFMYKEDTAAALRIAGLSGDKDLLALEKVRAAAQDGPLSDKQLATVPAKFAGDAGLRFAKIQIARRAGKISEAAALMADAPRDLPAVVDGDEWWVERRMIARKLLDANEFEPAYQIAAGHSAVSNESKIEAEFHAGWIALRFLKDPVRAKTHFATLAGLAITPMSRARAAYWQGRTAEAASEPADVFYTTAAAFPATYYGQLALARDGMRVPALVTPAVPDGKARSEAVRTVDALYLGGAKDLAISLATEGARNIREPEQVHALARVVARDRDAKVSLAIGKLAGYRGVALEELAFPTYGIPAFSPLPNSAELPLVFAIARQESAFDTQALSSAGAMGLMQMIASTAKRTAQRAGLAFDALRMRADPTFNAQLGAAHLGELLGEHDNSTILTLAAYNAGGKRVKEWIAAYGDPRRPDVDTVDWIERIPFTETRNYVQRVTENLTMYRGRLLARAAVPATGAITANASAPDAPAAASASAALAIGASVKN